MFGSSGWRYFPGCRRGRLFPGSNQGRGRVVSRKGKVGGHRTRHRGRFVWRRRGSSLDRVGEFNLRDGEVRSSSPARSGSFGCSSGPCFFTLPERSRFLSARELHYITASEGGKSLSPGALPPRSRSDLVPLGTLLRRKETWGLMMCTRSCSIRFFTSICSGSRSFSARRNTFPWPRSGG